MRIASLLALLLMPSLAHAAVSYVDKKGERIYVSSVEDIPPEYRTKKSAAAPASPKAAAKGASAQAESGTPGGSSAAGVATEATIEKILAVMEADKMMLALKGAFENVESSLTARLPKDKSADPRRAALDADIKAAGEELQKNALNYQQMKPLMIKLYQEFWTETEAQDLLRFYESPTGKKMVRTMPLVLQKSQELVVKHIESHLPAYIARLKEVVMKHYPELMKGDPKAAPAQQTL